MKSLPGSESSLSNENNEGLNPHVFPTDVLNQSISQNTAKYEREKGFCISLKNTFIFHLR
jgi:hypothetical protein